MRGAAVRRLEVGPPSEPEQDAVSATTGCRDKIRLRPGQGHCTARAHEETKPLPEMPAWVRLWGRGIPRLGIEMTVFNVQLSSQMTLP